MAKRPKTRPAPAVDPSNRQEIFELVYMKAYWLASITAAYRELFTNREYRSTMTRVAQKFFWMVQHATWHSIALSIAALLEPAGGVSGTRSTSLTTLLGTLTDQEMATVGRQLKRHLKSLQRDAEHIRDLRNREIAHLDLDTMLGNRPRPVLVNVKAVIQLSKGIERWLDTFTREVLKAPFAAGQSMGDDLGVDILMHRLGKLHTDTILFPLSTEGSV